MDAAVLHVDLFRHSGKSRRTRHPFRAVSAGGVSVFVFDLARPRAYAFSKVPS